MLRITCVCCVLSVYICPISRTAHAELPGQIVTGLSDGGDGPNWAISVIDPNIGSWERKLQGAAGGSPRVSPDGTTVAYLAGAGIIRTFDLRTPEKTRLLWNLQYDGSCKAIWGSDGKELIVCSDNPTVAKWRISVDGRQQQLLTIPDGHAIHDWSPDKQWVITILTEKQAICAMRLDGSELRQLVDAQWVANPRLSPDGRKLLFTQQRGESGVLELWVIDFDGKKKKRIREDDGPVSPLTACWSPDGKYLAVTLFKRGLAIGEARTWLEIMDAEGQNRRRFDLGDTVNLGACDWRPKPTEIPK